MSGMNGTATASVTAPTAALVASTRVEALSQTQNTAMRAAALEQVLIGGDLSRLNAEDRISYYRTLCESVGLNPLTKPFDYISLNGKLVLYAKRDCTDQLRFRDRISIRIVAREILDDVYVVTAQAKTPEGREDESTGAVPVANLKGEAKANAYMKAETKAKRRVTLSICGLGLLDESEVSSIPDAKPAPPAPLPPQVETAPPPPPPAEEPVDIGDNPPNSKAAAAHVRDRKLEQLRRTVTPISKPWKTNGEFVALCELLRERVGETRYNEELDLAGIDNPRDFINRQDGRGALAFYNRLQLIAEIGGIQ